MSVHNIATYFVDRINAWIYMDHMHVAWTACCKDSMFVWTACCMRIYIRHNKLGLDAIRIATGPHACRQS